jgi:recombination protein RecR
MAGAFEELQQCLKRLPGLGYRSAERLALHLLVEHPDAADQLLERLQVARASVRSCPQCGNLCEGDLCAICAADDRDSSLVCVVETVPDLRAMERAGTFRGRYHVLHGKLSPIHGIGPEALNLASLKERLAGGTVQEIILALSNDIEGEATCHFIREEILPDPAPVLSRIGFGLPSGGGIPYADSTTLRSALDGRRSYS